MIGTDGILRREADHDQTSDTDSEKHESDSIPHKKIKVDILEEKNETDQGKNYLITVLGQYFASNSRPN